MSKAHTYYVYTLYTNNYRSLKIFTGSQCLVQFKMYMYLHMPVFRMSNLLQIYRIQYNTQYIIYKRRIANG